MAANDKIVNFKAEPKLKEAIRLAAFYTGHANSSKFLKSIVMKNKDVKKEFEKLMVKN